MNQERIGAFIARLRAEKNLTQKELAGRLGVTDKAVSKWENGRCMPDILLLKPLCAELGITINELLNGEHDVSVIKTDENLIRILKEYRQMKKIRSGYCDISRSVMAGDLRRWKRAAALELLMQTSQAAFFWIVSLRCCQMKCSERTARWIGWHI